MENLPYVTAALICEKVLQEKDGTLSAMRIVDRVQVKLLEIKPGVQGIAEAKDVTAEQKFAAQIPLAALVCLKAGQAKTKFSITIDGVSPTQKTSRLFEIQVDFSETREEGGQNVVLNLLLATQEVGVHWFDVRADGQLLSRIPLVIETQYVPQA